MTLPPSLPPWSVASHTPTDREMARVMYTAEAQIRVCRINDKLRLCLLLDRRDSTSVLLVGGKQARGATLLPGGNLGSASVRVKSRGGVVYWSKVLHAVASSQQTTKKIIKKTCASMAQRSVLRKQLRDLLF